MIIHSSIDSPIMQNSQSDLIEKLKNLFFKNEKHAAVMSIDSDVSLFNCKRLIINSNDHIALCFSASFFQNWTLRADLSIESLYCNFILSEQQFINENHANLKKNCTDWNNNHKNWNKEENAHKFWFCCVFNVEQTLIKKVNYEKVEKTKFLFMNNYKQQENASILFSEISALGILWQCIKNYYHTFDITENCLIYASYKCENFSVFFIYIHILNEWFITLHNCLNWCSLQKQKNQFCNKCTTSICFY